MARRGRFITIEGGEGVGKSSLLKGLAEILRTAGHDVLVTREPGGTPSADRIRTLFALEDPLDPWLPEAEALLISAARAQHVGRVIAPALGRGAWVLCDRFADSTRVYQGVLGGLDTAKLETMIALSTGGLTPDLTLVLDCDVDVALSRIAQSSSGRSDEVVRFDQEDKARHEKRRAAYQQLVTTFGQRCHRLDGSQSPEAVLHAAATILGQQFAGELAIAKDLSRPPVSVSRVVPKT